jgi:hypothetical protein
VGSAAPSASAPTDVGDGAAGKSQMRYYRRAPVSLRTIRAWVDETEAVEREQAAVVP